MSKRSDVLKVLAGEKPEYVPWFGDLAYWLYYLKGENIIPDKYLQMGSTDPEKMIGGIADVISEEGLQQLHVDMGVGFHIQAYYPFEAIHHNVKVEVIPDGYGFTKRYITPYGTLQEVRRYIPETYSTAPVEWLIKGVDDLKAYRAIYEDVEYRPNYELAQKRLDTVGDNGIVLAYTPHSPLQELVVMAAGIETTVDLWMDAPDEFEDLLALMTEKLTIAAQIAIDSPAEMVMVPDNMSSEVTGGAFYDDYIREVHEDWTTRIRKAGKKSFVHLDGTLNPLLTKLSNAGFDVIEAVTPSPVGDIELEDLRSYVKDETIIWGCMPGGFFSPDFPDDEFDKWTIRVLDLMKKDHRFVLGVADEVVPHATPERIKRVNELVEQYGKFEG